MNVRQLRNLLSVLDDDANVLLAAAANPEHGDQCVGRPLHFAVSCLDGRDNTVLICTCRAEGSSDGPLTFSGAPSVSVASAETVAGVSAAAQALRSQLENAAAVTADVFVEGRRMRQSLERLNALISQPEQVDA